MKNFSVCVLRWVLLAGDGYRCFDFEKKKNQCVSLCTKRPSGSHRIDLSTGFYSHSSVATILDSAHHALHGLVLKLLTRLGEEQ